MAAVMSTHGYMSIITVKQQAEAAAHAGLFVKQQVDA